MTDFFEIVVAMLAVFGGYTLLDMLRIRLLYPKKVRMSLRAAVILEDDVRLCDAVSYALYLRREQKISPKRLIILTNDDIINVNDEISRYGEIYEYIKCKEFNDDK